MQRKKTTPPLIAILAIELTPSNKPLIILLSEMTPKSFILTSLELNQQFIIVF